MDDGIVANQTPQERAAAARECSRRQSWIEMIEDIGIPLSMWDDLNKSSEDKPSLGDLLIVSADPENRREGSLTALYPRYDENALSYGTYSVRLISPPLNNETCLAFGDIIYGDYLGLCTNEDEDGDLDRRYDVMAQDAYEMAQGNQGVPVIIGTGVEAAGEPDLLRSNSNYLNDLIENFSAYTLRRGDDGKPFVAVDSRCDFNDAIKQGMELSRNLTRQNTDIVDKAPRGPRI